MFSPSVCAKGLADNRYGSEAVPNFSLCKRFPDNWNGPDAVQTFSLCKKLADIWYDPEQYQLKKIWNLNRCPTISLAIAIFQTKL